MYFSAYNGAFLGQSLPPPPPIPRAASTGPETMSLHKSLLAKAKSTNSLRTKAAASAQAQAQSAIDQESSFRTIRDPRMASTSDLSRASSSSRNEGSKDEVAVLSDKLISAINHQQTLDDTLAHTRHDLEGANARAAELEAKIKEFELRIASGELMTKEAAEQQSEKFRVEAEETRKQNERLLLEKKSLQTDAENLSASLFEEANKMVATANEQKAATEKKNQQLRDQIKDGEAVIASQIEQLAQLKLLMQEIGSDHRKQLSDSPNLTPASPQLTKEDNLIRLLEAMNLSPVTPDHPSVAPSPSTQLTHLIKAQCRTDVPCYEDFKHMLSISNPRSHTPSHAPSRAGSGSYGGLSGLGLGYSTNNSSNTNLSAQAPSSSKLTTSPSLPGSFSPAPAQDSKGPQALKDTRFFKRLMAEDIEPTLRLDLSPQISWLQRRNILGAVADSNLIVEPIPESSIRLYGRYASCSVCGESRREGQNPRTHAMRTREGEGANKWAVCQLCLEKVRAVGDLIGYLRMVRDGVVKIADLKDEEEAWEEIIRLRERLFWARLAGGVVPAFIPSTKPSPVTVQEDGATPAVGSTEKGEHENGSDASKENLTPALQTPDGSRRGSEENPSRSKREGSETESEKEARLQLQSGLDESLTTFENAREKALQNSAKSGGGSGSPRAADTATPNTPSRLAHGKREGSGSGFPKINVSIPRIPSLPPGFWDTQMNSLH